mmetsp:Transcript_17483/g.37795  ORF Transcript_17483/g.37795 Transcript_17483/m.37795 type:complete len:374 (-) Transcript_17483:15-1136(-)
MASCTASRRSATILVLCILILLHFHQLHHFHFTRNYMTDVKSLGDEEVISQEAALQSQAQKVDNTSASFDHVFGENRTMTHSNAPPKEETWLLSSSNSNHSSHNDGRIPRIINKILFQKDGLFQEKIESNADPRKWVAAFSLQQAHQSWLHQNPGYHVRYFNLMLARKYLHKFFHPVFLRTFDCIQAFAGKADFFRMALLYHEGGFHSDWKQECLEPNILDRIANATDFFVAIDMGNPFAKKYFRQSKSCATNAFVGSTIRHPILARYLTIAMTNVQSSYYPSDGNPLLLTGPCAFGSAVRHFKKDFGNGSASWPIHEKDHFIWNGQKIISGKCKFCGYGQNWLQGNNYNTLARNRTYYCEDSASIFQENFFE